jgi:hypothetical protein
MCIHFIGLQIYVDALAAILQDFVTDLLPGVANNAKVYVINNPSILSCTFISKNNFIELKMEYGSAL